MRNQQGLSLIGLIFVSAVVIAIAVFGMKLAPSLIEYFTIMQHVKVIAAGSDAQRTVTDIRKAYDLRASLDATPSIAGADLEISKEGSQVVISFEYAKKIPIAGNVSICIDYYGSSSGSKRPSE